MKKRFIFLFILLVLFIPFKVNANIICRDGHVSETCSDCHQGCCSRHGGCDANSYDTGGGGGYVPEDTYVEPTPVVEDAQPVQEAEPLIEETPKEEVVEDNLEELEEESKEEIIKEEENQSIETQDNMTGDYSEDEDLYTMIGYGILGSMVGGSFLVMAINDKKEEKKRKEKKGIFKIFKKKEVKKSIFDRFKKNETKSILKKKKR